MATPNDDLSKILREIGIFQAEYLKLTADQKPDLCVLPPDGPGIPPLPPADLPDIHKLCAPIFVEFPVVTEPFVPPESCLDGIQFVKGSGDIKPSLSGAKTGSIDVSVVQSVTDFCNYNIFIPPVIIPCHPNGPTFVGQARINVVDLNAELSTTADIRLVKDNNAECRWILEGDLDIVIPEVPCPEGVSFNPGILKIKSTCPIVPSQQKIAQIVRTEDPCKYDIVLPELVIPCFPDGPKVHGDVTIKLKDRDTVFSTQKASIEPNSAVSCCDFELDGDIVIPIPCHTGVVFNNDTFNVKAVPSTPDDLVATKSVKIVRNKVGDVEDICSFNIDFPDIVVPCFPNGIQYDGAITFRTLDGELPTKIDFNAVRDPLVPCKFNLDPIDIEIPVPSCPGGISFSSNVVVKANNALIIPNTTDVEGKRRYHNLSLHARTGSPKNCGAILDGELNLGLPNFVTQCNNLVIGGNNSVRFTFNPAVTTSPVIGLRTLDSGCGFEFTGADINLPVLACDSAHGYDIQSNFNVYVGANKLGPSLNTIKLRPKYSDSPHCGVILEGDLRFPDVTAGSFNYVAWKLKGRDEAGEPYPPGTVASIVFPEGGRCAYRVIAPAGAPADVPPTAPAAKGVWEGLGCVDPKVFPPFKVIKTKAVGTNMSGIFEDAIVKVVPNSYLFKDIQKDAAFRIHGLDTPFYLFPGQVVYLECTFDASGNDITIIQAAIGVGAHWDDTVLVINSTEEVPSVFDQLYKTVTPKQAGFLLNSAIPYCEGQIARYAGLALPGETFGTEELLNIEQIAVLNKVSNVKDTRCRQFKAYVLIARAHEGKVQESTDEHDTLEVDDVQLKKEDRMYGVEQLLAEHLVLVSKNVDNVPLVIPERFGTKINTNVTRLPIPTIEYIETETESAITFTMDPVTDIFGQSRKIGVRSGDIHVYFTIDGSIPTISVEENTKCFLYDGATMRFPLGDVGKRISYMAVSPTFHRSFTRSY